MAKKGSLKKSLVVSALSLTLSASMLIGTTFAWFTDSVTNAGNKIQAGTLDIDLYDVTTGTEVEVTETSAPLFKYEKWEPGYKASKVLKVQNNGTLALKFKLDVVKTASVGTADICDVIEVWATAPATSYDVSNYEWQTDYTYCGTLNQMMAESDGAIHGTLLEGESAYQGIVLKMSEEAGNEYQGAVAEFDIRLNATQYTYESDSYDDTYDAGADYYGEVSNGTSFVGALANGENVKLIDDVVVTEPVVVPENTEAKIDLNGKTIELSQPITNSGTLVIGDSSDATATVSFASESASSSAGVFTSASGYVIENTGTVVVNGGTFAGLGGICSNGGKVTINGGTFTASSNWSTGTYHHVVRAQDTELIINGGTFDATIGGTNNAMIMVAGGSKVLVNGGTFKNVEGEIPNFPPYIFTYENGGALKINGGTFYGGWRFNMTATTEIYGGTFTIKTDGQSFAGNLHKLTVYGGTFAQFNPTNYLADCYVATQNANGTWTVSLNTASTAEELSAAIAAGQGVVLTADITDSLGGSGNAYPYVGNKSFVIDLNGHKITTTAGNSIFRFRNEVSGTNTITIKNGTLETDGKTWCTVIAGASNGGAIIVNLENLTIHAAKENSLSVKAFSGATVNMTNCKVYTTLGGAATACGGTLNILGDENEFVQTQTSSWANYCSNCVSVSDGGELNVYGGSFTSSYYAAVVMSSGGTMNLYGGAYATTDAEGRVVDAGVDGQYNPPYSAAVVNVYGGTYDRLTTDAQNDGIISVWDWTPTDSASTYLTVYADAVYGEVVNYYDGAKVEYK